MPLKSSVMARFSPRLRRLTRLLIIGLVVWSLVAWLAARYLVTQADLPHADALVVLSGSALYAERAQWAARLFKEGRAPRVILSNDNLRGGWSEADEKNLLFYERSRDELIRSGVPETKIVVLMQPVSSTYDEAISLRNYAAQNDLHSILIVTSPQHSRRALWTLRRVFNQTGIEIGLSPAVPGPRSPAPATWWWSPSGWRIVAGEYLKLVVYWIKYR